MAAEAEGGGKPAPLRPAPRDIRVINLVIFVTGTLAGMTAPFITQIFNKDLETAAFAGSALNLVGLLGAFFLSRLSDRLSRRTVLWLSFGAHVLVQLMNVLTPGLAAMCIGAFFSSGATSIISALLGDYCIAMEASVAETSSWLSTQQLLLAISAVVSPVLGPRLASTLDEMNVIQLAGVALVAPVVFLLQAPRVQHQERRWTVLEFVDLKVVRTGAGVWYLGWCFFLVFIYHFCQTILTPSLGGRFGADVEMLGQLQMVVGLGAILGTLSSAPIASYMCRPHPTTLISSFMLMTFGMRVVMFSCRTWPTYLVANFVFAFFGIGVINPVRSAMPQQFVPQDELGGYLGLKQSVEALSGVAGPALAGMVGLSLDLSPLSAAVLLLYGCTPLYAYFGYPRLLQPAVARMAALRKAKPE